MARETSVSGYDSWHVVRPSLSSPTARPASIPRRTSHESASGSLSPTLFGAWSSLPRHDSSIFFDDTESENIGNHDQRQGSAIQSPSHMTVSAVNPHSTSRHVAEEGEETDMLSLPSSLSVSDRSSSRSERGTSSESSPKLGQENPFKRLPSDSLTEAALSEIASKAKDADALGEADLTSGSDEESDMDPDESILSRTPDAISAGIRPLQRRPLQNLPMYSIPQKTQSSQGRVDMSPEKANLSSTTSSSCRSNGIKRRHRAAGVRDTGSKKSHTSSNGATEAHALRPDGKSKGKATSAKNTASGKDLGKAFYSLSEAARSLFRVDDDLMEIMAQPGSVFR